MNINRNKNTVYGAGEGDPSTGAVEGCQAGPSASTSCNRGRPGVDHQALGRASASGDEKRNVDYYPRPRRTSTDSSASCAEVSQSKYFWNELPLGRSSDDKKSPLGKPSSLVKLKKRPNRRIAAFDDDSTNENSDLETEGASGPVKKRSTAQSLRSDSNSREPMVGQTAAELDAQITHEMTEVERIATFSENLEPAFIRRLIIASRKTRAASAMLREQIDATCKTATPTSPLRYRRCSNSDDRGAEKEGEEDSEASPRTLERLRNLESKVGRLQQTVTRLTQGTETERSEDKKERAEGPTVTGTTTTTRMTPGVRTADMGLPRRLALSQRPFHGEACNNEEEKYRRSGRWPLRELLQELEDLFHFMITEMRLHMLPSQSPLPTKNKGVVPSGACAFPAAKSVRSQSGRDSSLSSMDTSEYEVDDSTNIVGSKVDRTKGRKNKNIERGAAAARNSKMTLAQVASELSEYAKVVRNFHRGEGKEKRKGRRRRRRRRKKKKKGEGLKELGARAERAGPSARSNIDLPLPPFALAEALLRIPRGVRPFNVNVAGHVPFIPNQCDRCGELGHSAMTCSIRRTG
uniref:uncharacterized protein LOC117161037 n=1 Tax=Bombus vancouverensis nearcticus TaxID=2705178 RepID=UPI001438A6CD|nr:uncharacterized protein LOC117161037 [Bombus vancouverensis nearcticus]